MNWDVEHTDEFEKWWVYDIDDGERQSIGARVALLEERGPDLDHPYSSGITTSAYSHMRELRIQHKGEPYRVLYAFDPRRTAILLIGGKKTGDDRWYEEYVPFADSLYSDYLEELRKEGLIK